MPVPVGQLGTHELREAAVLLARCFDDDPLFCYLFPQAGRRASVLVSLFAGVVADALPFGEVHAARRAGMLAGVAAWLPPGGFPPSRSRSVRMLPTLLRACALFPASALRLVRLLAADANVHIEEPHWYLPTIGVDPLLQGEGIGTALLSGVLDRLDRQNELAFLVTSRERNLRWYERLGFQVLDEVAVPASAPPFWPMLRQPLPTTGMA